ncbi:cytoplasmic protein, partial [Staphylococcus warneri]
KGQWDSSEHAISEVLALDTGRFIEITATGMLLRKEMAFESRYMQHCLGQFANLTELKDGYGEHYVTQKEYGLFRYFSLRDASNKPHVTISL